MMGRYGKYTDKVREVLSLARGEALRLRHRLISTEHLLLGILRLDDPLMRAFFVSLHTSSPDILQALDFVISRGRHALVSEPTLSASARIVLARAEECALEAAEELIGLEHLLMAIFAEQDGIVMGVLESFGIYPEMASQQLEMLLANGYEHLISRIKYREFYDATPTLNLVSRDLTLEALENRLSPFIGRDSELERTMQILSRRTKHNPVLIGPAGVGKTAIAEAVAWRIIRGQVPDPLLGSRVVALDIGLLAFGTKFRGDFEERLKHILQEILTNPHIVIVIDELHTLVQTGVAEGSLDAAQLFKPLLARGTLRCIGTTTLDEYRKTIERDPALERRFQPVLVPETNPVETLNILYGLRSSYENFHHVTISDEALRAAVSLSSRYIQGRYQPDKALDVVDEAASRSLVQRSLASNTILQLRAEVAGIQRQKNEAIAMRNFSLAASLLRDERALRKSLFQAEYDWRLKQRDTQPSLNEQDITEIIALRTGIPSTRISQEEQQQLLNLEQTLSQRVIGQQEATQAVARAIRRSRANIRDPRRPIGAFLFVGPSGVGKTELARALAFSLFGDEHALFKLDMSEFMEYHHVSRLIGAPPGYAGYEQAGQLTELVRRRPYSLILFDEIEKAHPRIFDLLLQMLEDGSLTDTHGQTVSFRHAIIIVTSNIGTEHHLPGPILPVKYREKSCRPQFDEHIWNCLRQTFQPELLNRFDEVTIFHPLQPEHLRKIVYLMVEQVQQRLAIKCVRLRVTETAYHYLAQQGSDPVYGARPLRRAVQRLLEDTLAEAILRGAVVPGTTVDFDVVAGKAHLRLTSAQEQSAA